MLTFDNYFPVPHVAGNRFQMDLLCEISGKQAAADQSLLTLFTLSFFKVSAVFTSFQASGTSPSWKWNEGRLDKEQIRSLESSFTSLYAKYGGILWSTLSGPTDTCMLSGSTQQGQLEKAAEVYALLGFKNLQEWRQLLWATHSRVQQPPPWEKEYILTFRWNIMCFALCLLPLEYSWVLLTRVCLHLL